MTTLAPIFTPEQFTFNPLGYMSSPQTQVTGEGLFDVEFIGDAAFAELQKAYREISLEEALALDDYVMQEVSERLGFWYRRVPESGSYDDSAFEVEASRLGVNSFDLRALVDGLPGMYTSDALLDLIAADMLVEPVLLRAWRIHVFKQHVLSSCEGEQDGLVWVWAPELGGTDQTGVAKCAWAIIERALIEKGLTVSKPTVEQMDELIHYRAPLPKVLKEICDAKLIPYSLAVCWWHSLADVETV